MRTIGFSEAEEIRKVDIALRQLDDAIHLFVSERFISALTLAGAAEEILARLLEAEGKKPATVTSYELIKHFRQVLDLDPKIDRKSKSQFFKEWNHDRNRVKHHDKGEPESILLNGCDAAYWMLRRAFANAKDLGLEVSSEQDFEKWMIKNINL